MHFIIIKNLLISSVLLVILSHCQLQEQTKSWFYFRKQIKKVIINKTNKNDVIRLFSSASTSFNNQNEWLYLKVITKGEYHQLGKCFKNK